eukprot:scaffold18968_cov114-Isochrysis_galbana.AAC.4
MEVMALSCRYSSFSRQLGSRPITREIRFPFSHSRSRNGYCRSASPSIRSSPDWPRCSSVIALRCLTGMRCSMATRRPIGGGAGRRAPLSASCSARSRAPPPMLAATGVTAGSEFCCCRFPDIPTPSCYE